MQKGIGMQRYVRGGLIALLFLVQGPPSSSYAQQMTKWQRVLIETQKPYDRIVQAVEASGGRVTQQFTYVDAIAAEVLEEAVPAIGRLEGVRAVIKDAEIQTPASAHPTRARITGQPQSALVTISSAAPPVQILSTGVKTLAINSPQSYSINNAGTEIERLHALGFTGNGVIVAMIDSGVRRGFNVADDSVIGGFDLVDDGAPGPGGDSQADWKKASNEGHGTFGAGLIAGKESFPVSGVMESALQQYAPGAIVDGKLPLIGTAPDARIYAVRVFGDNPAVGASLSTILAAIQHVIDQRALYDNTQGKKGVKIQVANLSLGRSTLAAGQTLLDTSVDRMLTAGIVPVVSVGDVGPSALTTSSPGSSRSAVTVGGTNPAANERILYEVQHATESPEDYYAGIGGDIRPFNGTEIEFSSSRGPNADGRLDPDIVALGVGNISQGYCPDQILDACFESLSIGSGTSFSAPIVSGIAATLVSVFPNATATQIRNALITSGSAAKIEPYFDALDRGRGLVDAYAAYLLLTSGTVPDVLPPFNPPWDLPVEDNIEQNPGVIVRSGNVNNVMSGLKPGQRAEILYAVPPDTDRVIVSVRDVQMSGPQNVFYGSDRLFLYVHSAKTSSIGGLGDYLENGELLPGGQPERVFELANPDTGVMRITLNPDGLNAGQIRASVRVQTIPKSIASTQVINDTIANAQIKTYPLTVTDATGRLEFVLTWDNDWAHYPTADVDLLVCVPTIPVADCRTLGDKQAATLASPERASFQKPAFGPWAGTWTLMVHGFNVPTLNGTDNFRLRINAVP